jgi:hypothetical protein
MSTLDETPLFALKVLQSRSGGAVMAVGLVLIVVFLVKVRIDILC